MHSNFNLFKTTLCKRTLLFLIISGLLGQNLVLIAEEASIQVNRGIPYATLATFFPTPLELSPEKDSSATATTPKQSDSDDEDEDIDEDINEKLNNDFSTLSLHQKRKMAFDLLSTSEAPQEVDPTTTTLLHELEIFTNRNNPEAPSVFSSLNRTSTVFGEVSLAYMLANPTDDLSILSKRQAIVRELAENEALFTSLDEALSRVKNAENGFLAFAFDTLQKQKEEEEKARKENEPSFFSCITKPIYNGITYLTKPLDPLVKAARTSPVVLQGQKIASDVWLPATGIYSVYLAQIIENRLRRTQSLLDNSLEAAATPSPSAKSLFPWRELNPLNYKALYHEIVQKLIAQNMSPEHAQTEALKDVGLLAVSNLSQALTTYFTIYNYLKWIKRANADALILHKKMNDTAAIVIMSKTLSSVIEQHSSFKEGFTSQKVLTDFFNPKNNQDLKRLLGYLQTDTFKGEPSYFCYYGRVLASETLSENHIKTLISVMKAIGEIDAYMAIAKLYKESQQESVHYCFASYQSATTPSLSLQSFWHPLIAREKVVTNDLAIGDFDNKGIILTGSNTGGKSTILKSALLSILLAQTFTLAPAEATTITPFALLGSYLSVSDDISAGNSLFKAEVLRAKNLLQNINDLQPGKVAFVVIDELFTGTAADKGSAAACKVADALANKNNVTYILATHFPELTLLEKTTNGRCKNYQIDVVRHSDGSITRPFKITPGISTTSIANDLLQEELVDLAF